MKRVNIEDLKEIEKDIDNGTAALKWVYNPLKGKNGLIKENGCMVGLYNEDIRELLASTILNRIGIPSAQIDLGCDTDENCYAISYDVLKNYQHHIMFEYTKGAANASSVDEYFSIVKNNISSLEGIKPDEIEKVFARIIEINFIDTIINQFDQKGANAYIIYDEVMKRYMPPIAYDFGSAFAKNSIQRTGVFSVYSKEEVMESLMNNYMDVLEPIIKNINKLYQSGELFKIMGSEEFRDLDTELLVSDTIENIDYMNNILSDIKQVVK